MSNNHLNYQHAKIYKIYSPLNIDVGEYIGSTCLPLNYRLQEHKRSFRKFIGYEKPMENSRAVLQFHDVKIELIENYPCKNKQELEQRELEHIQQSKNALNSRRH
jgi:hypothetical protein